jgi:DNA segregation ATPase FtsK/SpoIIIE, S-DNA-T family
VSEALGVLLLLAGVLAALSLYSYDPRDPNLFSLTTGEAESPLNWIGGFGASLSAALYQTLGFAAWTVPVILAFWGVRRFAARPFENRGSKAVGFMLLFLAVPALLSLSFARRPISG